MSTLSASPPRTRAAIPDPVIARWAGGLALANVVLMMGGFALEGAASVEHGTPAAKVLHSYAGLSMVKSLTGGYIESLSFIVLVPALVLLAHVFSRRTDLGRLASRTFLALGVAYVASTLAVGFPPGAAAVYAAQHGIDAGTIATVNDIRNYGFVLQVALSMAMTAAIGVAALAERHHARWIGWGGLAFGVLGLALTPVGHNVISTVWLVWWIGLGVVLLREKSPQD